jgi:hypothetical protein
MLFSTVSIRKKWVAGAKSVTVHDAIRRGQAQIFGVTFSGGFFVKLPKN